MCLLLRRRRRLVVQNILVVVLAWCCSHISSSFSSRQSGLALFDVAFVRELNDARLRFSLPFLVRHLPFHVEAKRFHAASYMSRIIGRRRRLRFRVRAVDRAVDLAFRFRDDNLPVVRVRRYSLLLHHQLVFFFFTSPMSSSCFHHHHHHLLVVACVVVFLQKVTTTTTTTPVVIKVLFPLPPPLALFGSSFLTTKTRRRRRQRRHLSRTPIYSLVSRLLVCRIQFQIFFLY